MLRQFFKDSAVYGIASFVVQSFSFFLLPLYTRVLTQAEYGITDILGIVNTVAAIVVPLSLISGVERYYTGAQTDDEKIYYASTSLWFTMAAYTLAVLISYPFSQTFSSILLSSPDKGGTFRLFLIAAWIYGMFNLLQFQLRIMFKSAEYGIVSFSATLAALAVTVFLVVFLRLGVRGVIGGWCAQYFFGGIVAYYFARKVYKLRFSSLHLIEMLKFSLPLVPSGIIVLAIVYVDRFAIRSLMTMEDVGLFAVAYKLVVPIYSINTPIANALNPLIYTRYREPQTAGEVARIFKYVMAMSLLIFAGYSLFAKEVLAVMAPASYARAAQIMPLMAWVMILNLLPFFAPGLTIAKKTGILAAVHGLVAILSTLLNFLLIPYLGIFGSALSNVIGLLALFGLRMYYSQKYYLIPFDWKNIAAALVATIFVVAIALSLSLPFWSLLALKIVFFLLVIGIVIFFGLVEWDTVIKFRIVAHGYLKNLLVREI